MAKFDDGWDVERERVFAVAAGKWGSCPREPSPKRRATPALSVWNGLCPERDSASQARLQEAYAAFLDHTDAEIGRLVDTLAELGVLENTLVLVPSETEEINVDGCGVFEGRVRADVAGEESWIDTQVEMSDKSNEF